jgi:hypothetical protein
VNLNMKPQALGSLSGRNSETAPHMEQWGTGE